MKKFLTFVMALAFFVPLLNLSICLASNMPHVHFDKKWIRPGKWQEIVEEEEEEDTAEPEKLENNNCKALKEYSSEMEEDLFDCSNDSTDSDNSIDVNIKQVAGSSETENFPISDWDKEYNYDNINLGDTFNISCLLI